MAFLLTLQALEDEEELELISKTISISQKKLRSSTTRCRKFPQKVWMLLMCPDLKMHYALLLMIQIVLFAPKGQHILLETSTFATIHRNRVKSSNTWRKMDLGMY